MTNVFVVVQFYIWFKFHHMYCNMTSLKQRKRNWNEWINLNYNYLCLPHIRFYTRSSARCGTLGSARELWELFMKNKKKLRLFSEGQWYSHLSDLNSGLKLYMFVLLENLGKWGEGEVGGTKYQKNFRARENSVKKKSCSLSKP